MIREKLTKNARCPCGSGKKYGKCCQGTQPINFLPQKSLIAQALEQALRPGVPPKVLKKVQELHERGRLIEHVTKIFREREELEREFVDRYGHARPQWR